MGRPFCPQQGSTTFPPLRPAWAPRSLARPTSTCPGSLCPSHKRKPTPSIRSHPSTVQGLRCTRSHLPRTLRISAPQIHVHSTSHLKHVHVWLPYREKTRPIPKYTAAPGRCVCFVTWQPVPMGIGGSLSFPSGSKHTPGSPVPPTRRAPGGTVVPLRCGCLAPAPVSHASSA